MIDSYQKINLNDLKFDFFNDEISKKRQQRQIATQQTLSL